jgi:hypothetical protein
MSNACIFLFGCIPPALLSVEQRSWEILLTRARLYRSLGEDGLALADAFGVIEIEPSKSEVSHPVHFFKQELANWQVRETWCHPSIGRSFLFFLSSQGLRGGSGESTATAKVPGRSEDVVRRHSRGLWAESSRPTAQSRSGDGRRQALRVQM